MWTRCVSSCLGFLIFLYHRVLAGEEVDGYMGENVLLPCRGNLSNTPQPTVFWRFGNDRNVYDIVKGVNDQQKQDPQFKDRANVFPEEYTKGNFSLRLTNLKSSDAGLYLCYIIGENRHNEVTLQIKAKPTTYIKITGSSGGADGWTPKMALILPSLLGAVLPHLYR